MSQAFQVLAIAGLVATAWAAATAQNLLVNGGFEASSSTTLAPAGWFNLGAANGVLTYSAIATQPVYEGLRFYDIGAHGNGIAAAKASARPSRASSARPTGSASA